MQNKETTKQRTSHNEGAQFRPKVSQQKQSSQKRSGQLKDSSLVDHGKSKSIVAKAAQSCRSSSDREQAKAA
jgi:hypothetical protein